jgi:hypothetical protein
MALPAGRVTIGVVALVRPDLMARAWVGAAQAAGPTAAMLGRATGGRDIALRSMDSTLEHRMIVKDIAKRHCALQVMAGSGRMGGQQANQPLQGGSSMPVTV